MGIHGDRFTAECAIDSEDESALANGAGWLVHSAANNVASFKFRNQTNFISLNPNVSARSDSKRICTPSDPFPAQREIAVAKTNNNATEMKSKPNMKGKKEKHAQ